MSGSVPPASPTGLQWHGQGILLPPLPLYTNIGGGTRCVSASFFAPTTRRRVSEYINFQGHLCENFWSLLLNIRAG